MPPHPPWPWCSHLSPVHVMELPLFAAHYVPLQMLLVALHLVLWQTLQSMSPSWVRMDQLPTIRVHNHLPTGFGSMPLVANNSPAVGHHYANQKNAHLQQGSNILDLTCFFFCLFFSRFLDLEHCNGVALQNLSSPLRKKSLLTKKIHQIQH